MVSYLAAGGKIYKKRLLEHVKDLKGKWDACGRASKKEIFGQV